jgi:hypothetical protein
MTLPDPTSTSAMTAKTVKINRPRRSANIQTTSRLKIIVHLPGARKYVCHTHAVEHWDGITIFKLDTV